MQKEKHASQISHGVEMVHVSNPLLMPSLQASLSSSENGKIGKTTSSERTPLSALLHGELERSSHNEAQWSRRNALQNLAIPCFLLLCPIVFIFAFVSMYAVESFDELLLLNEYSLVLCCTGCIWALQLSTASIALPKKWYRYAILGLYIILIIILLSINARPRPSIAASSVQRGICRSAREYSELEDDIDVVCNDRLDKTSYFTDAASVDSESTPFRLKAMLRTADAFRVFLHAYKKLETEYKDRRPLCNGREILRNSEEALESINAVLCAFILPRCDSKCRVIKARNDPRFCMSTLATCDDMMNKWKDGLFSTGLVNDLLYGLQEPHVKALTESMLMKYDISLVEMASILNYSVVKIETLMNEDKICELGDSVKDNVDGPCSSSSLRQDASSDQRSLNMWTSLRRTSGYSSLALTSVLCWATVCMELKRKEKLRLKASNRGIFPTFFALQVFITGVSIIYVRKFVTEDIAALGENVKGHAVFLSYMMVLLIPLALSSPVLNHMEGPEVMVDSHPQDICDDDNDTAEGRMEEEKAGYCQCVMNVLARCTLCYRVSAFWCLFCCKLKVAQSILRCKDIAGSCAASLKSISAKCCCKKEEQVAEDGVKATSKTYSLKSHASFWLKNAILQPPTMRDEYYDVYLDYNSFVAFLSQLFAIWARMRTVDAELTLRHAALVAAHHLLVAYNHHVLARWSKQQQAILLQAIVGVIFNVGYVFVILLSKPLASTTLELYIAQLNGVLRPLFMASYSIHQIQLSVLGGMKSKSEVAEMDEETRSRCKALRRALRKRRLIAFFALLLPIYIGCRFSIQAAVCMDKVGPSASCAHPKMYFQGGLFGPSSCGFGNVSELDCSGRNIALLPSKIPELMHGLSRIDFSHNPLKSLPDSFGELTELRALDLSGTWKLKSLPYMPNIRGSLKSINLAGSPARKSLQWSSKNISGTFDVEFAYVLGTRLPDLRVIDLSKNSIRITSSLLAEFVESFHDLRVLNLSVNALQKENCSLGKLTLEECRSIGKSKAIIDLSYNSGCELALLSSTDKSCQRQLETLRCLKCGGVGFMNAADDEESRKFLISALAFMRQNGLFLRRLVMLGSGVAADRTPNTCPMLVHAVKEIIAYSSQTLKHIQIIDTCMNGTLESGIFGKCEKLQHLQLSGNRLYGEFPRVPSSLQTLIIYNTPFSGRFSLAREMTNLTMFGAYETCIETIDWQGWKPALESIKLGGASCSYLDKHACEMLHEHPICRNMGTISVNFSDFPALRYLRIRKANITFSAGMRIPSNFRSMEIKYSPIHFGGSKRLLGKALGNLKRFVLWAIKWGTRAMVSSLNASSIDSLSISWPCGHPQPTTCISFHSNLTKFSRLKSLEFSGTSIDPPNVDLGAFPLLRSAKFACMRTYPLNISSYGRTDPDQVVVTGPAAKGC